MWLLLIGYYCMSMMWAFFVVVAFLSVQWSEKFPTAQFGGLLLKEQVRLLPKQTYKKQSTIFVVLATATFIHIHICTALLFCFPAITSSAFCLMTLWHTEWRSRVWFPNLGRQPALPPGSKHSFPLEWHWHFFVWFSYHIQFLVSYVGIKCSY